MEDYSDTIITCNQYLTDKNYPRDRESLSIEVTEMLYELLNSWSDANKTFEAWEKAAAKDFGDLIFIHADDAITCVHVELLINKDGIHLKMDIACPDKLPVMPDTWPGHHLFIKGSGEIWLALLDRDIEARGEIREAGQIYQNQVAQTMAGLTALPFETIHGTGKPIDVSAAMHYNSGVTSTASKK